MRTTFVETLMEAALRGDRAEFDRLFDTGFPVFYALAFRRAGGEQAAAERATALLLQAAMERALVAAAPPRDASAEPTPKHPTRGAA